MVQLALRTAGSQHVFSRLGQLSASQQVSLLSFPDILTIELCFPRKSWIEHHLPVGHKIDPVDPVAA